MRWADDIDPLGGFFGGALLGLASTVMMYGYGKITGMSGIVSSSVIFTPHDDKRWAWSFVAGAIVGGIIFINAHPSSFDSESTATTGALIVAGIITGVGTRVGAGCTSGHGICGLSRLSPRSLVAVGTFMFVAVITAIICQGTDLKDLVVRKNPVSNSVLGEPALLLAPSVSVAVVIMALFSYNFWLYPMLGRPYKEGATAVIPAQVWVMTFCCGVVSGLALALSNMCDPQKVIQFLNFPGDEGWDPTLAFVMAGGVMVNIVSFYFLAQKDHPPLLAPEGSAKLSSIIKYKLHDDNLKIDYKLIGGSVLFGIGWGMVGVCPGPALVNLGAYRRDSAVLMPSMLAGFAIFEVTWGSSLLSYTTWFPNSVDPNQPRCNDCEIGPCEDDNLVSGTPSHAASKRSISLADANNK